MGTPRSLLKKIGWAFPALFSLGAQAADIETHGFFTLGYATSNSDVKYLGSVTNRGSFYALSDAGVQLGGAINDRLGVKLQLVAQGRQEQSLVPKVDLAQLRYLISPRFEVLVGQVRLPLFMISDYRMVGALYPWSVPPAEVYQLLPDEAVGSNETLIGANLLTQVFEVGGWALQMESYAGGNSVRLEPPGRQIDATSKRIVGLNASLTHDRLLLRASYLNTLNQSTTLVLQGAGGPTSSDTSLGTIQFLTAGARWEPGDLLLQSEFGHIFAESPRFRKVYSYYGTLGYHFFARHLLLHGTVAQILPATDSTDSLVQTSFSLGANVSLAESVVFKLEAQRSAPGTVERPGAGGGAGAAGNLPQQGLFGGTQTSAVTLFFASVSAAF